MKKEMLINVLQPEECRIAIVEDGILEELYVERSSQESYVGNIYKGRIVNIEPSIQAAFVDFGIGRNGFLHVSDVDPAYYKHLLSREDLARYEAELDREHGGGGSGSSGRDSRDRSGAGGVQDRGARAPMPPRLAPPRAPITERLPSPPIRTVAPPVESDEETADFASGIVDDDSVPIGHHVESEEFLDEEPDAVAIEDESKFAEAVEDIAAPLPKAEFVLDDEDDFAAGVVEPTPVSEPQRLETVAAPIQSDHQPIAAVGIVEAHQQHVAASTYDDDDDGFGEGIIDRVTSLSDLVGAPAIEPEPSADVPEVAAVTEVAKVAGAEAGVPEAVDVVPGVPDVVPEAAESVEGADATELKAKKPRGRRPKKADDSKVDEGLEPGGETVTDAPAEAKPKGRPRKAKKKSDGDAEIETPEVPEDKPRYMPGAERRTSPNDESEPEIRPFFEGGAADDFDIDAPNDRFAGLSDQQPGNDQDSETSEVPEDAEVPFGDELGESSITEAPPAPVTGRGFNDDYEDARAERQGRERGGRGGPNRDRDRDRGGRGGPSRDRGGRGGPGGPGRDRGPRSGPGGPRTASRDRGLPKPQIQEIFKRGQEVIVQVIKEGIGTKGPTLSTYISIAGRYLVLMPSLNRVGVSRKIEDHDARRRLREIMNTLNPPRGVGFIVRTAAVDRDAQELRNDLAYLLRLWQVVVRRIKRVAAPVEIYRESDMITRTIRDIFTSDVDAIWVDEPTAFAHASEFLQIVMPRYANRIRFVDDTEPLFHKYAIEDEIAKIHQKRIDLPEGGSIIIEQTEALVAIDVNSGNFRADNNAEETAYQMNLRAAREIARQLRLRDLGGVIVNDFIDMRDERHRRNVENALRDAMRRDRARAKILRISQFGIIEMTRQRIRPSLKRSLFADCSHCRGTGFVKTSESMSIEVMRMVHLAAHRAPGIASMQVIVHTDVAQFLLNRKRKELAAIEERTKMEITVTGQIGISPDSGTFKCFDSNGNEVRLLPPPAPPRLPAGNRPGPGGGRYPDRGRG